MREIGLVAGLAVLLVAGSAQAATLNVVGGILYGASGVDVGGTLYDVEFVDGTCIDLFDGCDELADFAFTDTAAAQAASTALVGQVYPEFSAVVGATVVYANIQGCEASVALECEAQTPFSDYLSSTTDVFVSEAFARSTGFTWGGDSGWPKGEDTAERLDKTWARWNLTPIPEPTTGLMLGLGLLGVAVRRRV
jgi:hypothetical protein